MKCPKCNNQLKVYETVNDHEKHLTFRSYKCNTCGSRYLSIESIIPDDDGLHDVAELRKNIVRNKYVRISERN